MTILYADDDEEDQEVFAEIIRAIDSNITVLKANDGLHTFEILSHGNEPDIIFLDFNMPFLNGHQTLIKIRKEERFRDIRVVIFSTNLYEDAYAEIASMNVQFVRKPNTLHEGIETLKTIIRPTTAG